MGGLVFGIIGLIFQTIWGIVNIDWTIDGITFNLWQFNLFFIMVGVLIKQIIKFNNSDAGMKNNGGKK